MQLFLAVAQLGLFHLYDDVGDGGAVGVEHDDIGPLGTVAAEGDGVLDLNARRRVAVLLDKPGEPQLPRARLGVEVDFLAAHEAAHIWNKHAAPVSTNEAFAAIVVIARKRT